MTEHEIRADEPVWQGRTFTLADGDVDVEIACNGFIGGMEDQATYDCTCGKSFDNEDEAISHLKEQ